MDKLSCETVVRAVLGEPVKQQGAELLYRCPYPERHNNGDSHPSLQINRKRDLWGCFVCDQHGKGGWSLAAFFAGVDPGDKAAITESLKEHGLLNGGAKRNAHAEGRGQRVAEYVYRDGSGNPVARKLRFEPGANGRKKDFAWQRLQGKKWVDGLGSVKIPLYRLPEILNEPFVILTEGEKDADAGSKIGLPTATSGGVNSWREEHADSLLGKAVAIIAHSDEPGRKEAQLRAASLFGKAASVKVCEIPGSKDLAEAIGKGTPREALLALFSEAPEWGPATCADILDSTMHFVRRFVSLTEPQARAVTMWVAHTHCFEAAVCTPYLTVNSPEKQSGKTRLLEVVRLLVCSPWFTGRVTAAVLVRKIDAKQPTLLLDESDAAFSGEKEYAEALRAVLNSGYRRGGCASLCVGQGVNISYKDFSTFCPKAIAGIGKLPDTVADRSIPIRLKRAQRGKVERFRERDAEPEAAQLQAMLAVWAQANLDRLREARPAIPSELSDRQSDVCEPFLAIADAARGDWPQVARRALVELCVGAQADDDSDGTRLLHDVQSIFRDRELDEMASGQLCEALAQIETSPWGEWNKGKPLSPSKLARLLKPFDIFPDRIGDRNSRVRGYKLSQFQDAFSRYIPPENVHPSTNREYSGDQGDFKASTKGSVDTSKNAVSPAQNAGRGHVDTLKPRTKTCKAEQPTLSPDEVDVEREG